MQQPLHCIHAEQAIIGGLLHDNLTWAEVREHVTESDFFHDDHQQIFHHISVLMSADKSVDVLSVIGSLNMAYENTPGSHVSCSLAHLHKYLSELASAVPSAGNVKNSAKIVHEKAMLRALINECDQIIKSAHHPVKRDAWEILDEAEARIFGIADSYPSLLSTLDSKSITLANALQPALDRINEVRMNGNPNEVTGIVTGFIDLDKITSGLQCGDVVFLAGRPSMGKRTLAMNIAEYVGVELGLPVLIISLQLPAAQLASEFLSSRSEIAIWKLRKELLSDEETNRLISEAERLRQADIHIDDDGMIRSIPDLRARIRRNHRKCNGLGLIVIDSLQVLANTLCNGKSVAELGKITKTIKALAKEMGVSIIVLSDLSRKLEYRSDKRPVLSDLRKCGINDQDADVVLMLYRDEYYKDDSDDKGLAEVFIRKNRNGPAGSVQLTAHLERCKFERRIHV